MLARKFNRRPARWAAVLAAALFAAVAGGAQAGPRCAFPTPPTVLVQDGDAHAKGGRLLQVWDIPNARVLWSRAEPPGYAAFRAKAARLAGETDPVWLLRQTGFRNSAIVAAHAKAWIRPATCLEKLLFQIQDRRIDTFEAPTEFVSFVLRSPDGRRLKVYFYTVNQDGIGRASPVSDPVRTDAAAGWRVLANLHNHNFHPGDPDTNGPLAPSLPDAQVNRNLAAATGLEAAWITNGLHTARIPASAFGAFEAPPD